MTQFSLKTTKNFCVVSVLSEIPQLMGIALEIVERELWAVVQLAH